MEMGVTVDMIRNKVTAAGKAIRIQNKSQSKSQIVQNLHYLLYSIYYSQLYCNLFDK